jgi:hypothetical protein
MNDNVYYINKKDTWNRIHSELLVTILRFEYLKNSISFSTSSLPTHYSPERQKPVCCQKTAIDDAIPSPGAWQGNHGATGEATCTRGAAFQTLMLRIRKLPKKNHRRFRAKKEKNND